MFKRFLIFCFLSFQVPMAIIANENINNENCVSQITHVSDAQATQEELILVDAKKLRELNHSLVKFNKELEKNIGYMQLMTVLTSFMALYIFFHH